MSGKTSTTPAQSSSAKLFLVVSTALFIVWVGAMVAMYVTTVYPQRYPSSAPSTRTK